MNGRLASRVRLQLRDTAQRIAIVSERRKPCAPIATLARAYRDGGGKQVLVFGDSVGGRTARYDIVRATLLELVEDDLAPRLTTCAIAHPGFHPGVYLALVRALAVLRRRPEIVVVPINIRCFSPQWALNPKWQFDHVIAASERFRADPTNVPRGKVDVLSNEAAIERFMAAPAQVVGYEGWSIGDFERRIRGRSEISLSDVERRRLTFAYHYLSLVDPANPRVCALRQLLRTANELGCAIAAYFTPINYEAGRSLHGDVFDHILAANVDVVQAAIAPVADGAHSQMSIEDWTRQLSSAAFFHPLLPTEHLNESGRRRLAVEIVRSTNALARNRA